MKVPDIFVPEKNLEANIKKLFSKNDPNKEHPIVFNNLKIQRTVSSGGPSSVSYSFDKSLENLREEGYDRHFYPWERFELILDYLEGMLEGDLEKFSEGLIKSSAEWLNIAVERKANKLICYTDPENIKYDMNGCYIIDSTFKYKDKKEFNFKGVPFGWAQLDKLDDNFVKYFCTRKFKELPKEIQDGKLPILFRSPLNGILWPMTMGYWYKSIRYDTYIYATSRGVSIKK